MNLGDKLISVYQESRKFICSDGMQSQSAKIYKMQGIKRESLTYQSCRDLVHFNNPFIHAFKKTYWIISTM